MTLNFVTGYSTDLKKAKEFAIFFYNEREGRKRFEAVESQTGENEIGDQVWITTIWYTELADPVEQQKPEEKFEFIGSTDIDPNDPDWREKLAARHAAMEEITAFGESTGDYTVTTNPTVEMVVNHAQEGT